MEVFLHSFQSEWVKRKRSAAAWLTVAGALLVPVILIIARCIDTDGLAVVNRSEHLWESVYNRSWQLMGFFLLPMGLVLATSLITQLEYRSNAWKQLAASPLPLTTVFLAKLAVILVMLLQFFILFNIGLYLEGVVPSLMPGVPYPPERVPFMAFLRGNSRFLLDCLPIVAFQYGLSLLVRNFMVPLGAGLGLYVASMAATHWRYGYAVPYSYPLLEGIGQRGLLHGVDFHLWAAAYFIVFLLLGYILYITKKEKG